VNGALTFPAPQNALAGEAFWMDLLRAEPIEDRLSLWQDLSAVDVVYLGETHRLKRHHREQVAVFKELANRGRRVVLGLEALERRDQTEIDRFNSGEIDFRTLAENIDWQAQWANFEDYRELLEAAHHAGARVVGLNAPRQIIHKIGRNCIDSLDAAERRALAEQLDFEDPVYRRLMDRVMMVHASFEASDLKKVFQAQVARDETMAETLVQAFEALAGTGERPVAIVVTGSGHVRFGLGVPDRVRARIPGVKDRILLMSESGDLILTPSERAASRKIELSHENLAEIGRSAGNYLFLSPRD
jgi:uncharacterized iron-regulated protein